MSFEAFMKRSDERCGKLVTLLDQQLVESNKNLTKKVEAFDTIGILDEITGSTDIQKESII
jgi:hypothetical protein